MKEELQNWIEEFVSVYNENLKQIPCPFAKKAIIDKTVRYVPSSKSTIAGKLELYANLWNDTYEVAIFYIMDDITPEELSTVVENFNDKFMPRDFVVLEDHPDDPEIMNGVSMNFGKAPLVLLQRLSKINWASEQLHKRGYYKSWPEENYKDVVEWRFHK